MYHAYGWMCYSVYMYMNVIIEFKACTMYKLHHMYTIAWPINAVFMYMYIHVHVHVLYMCTGVWYPNGWNES